MDSKDIQTLALLTRIAVALEAIAEQLEYSNNAMSKDKKLSVDVSGFLNTKQQQ